jgi:hypothetical protein
VLSLSTTQASTTKFVPLLLVSALCCKKKLENKQSRVWKLVAQQKLRIVHSALESGAFSGISRLACCLVSWLYGLGFVP